LVFYSEGQAGKPYRFLVRKLQRKKLLGKSEHKLENSIATGLREFGYETENQIRLILYSF
jgi:hypothetical protein